jgi:hypothetical protein
MAMLNFGGHQTVSTSVQNFVRTMLRKRGFGCSMPPPFQVLRPPIQLNHRLLNLGVAYFAYAVIAKARPRLSVAVASVLATTSGGVAEPAALVEKWSGIPDRRRS